MVCGSALRKFGRLKLFVKDEKPDTTHSLVGDFTRARWETVAGPIYLCKKCGARVCNSLNRISGEDQ